MAIMSDSSIGLKPVIDEPSKPIPPSNASSSSEALIEKLFSWPRTSVNQSRMKRTSLSRDELRHVFGGFGPICRHRREPYRRRLRRAAPNRVAACVSGTTLERVRTCVTLRLRRYNDLPQVSNWLKVK